MKTEIDTDKTDEFKPGDCFAAGGTAYISIDIADYTDSSKRLIHGASLSTGEVVSFNSDQLKTITRLEPVGGVMRFKIK